MGLHTFLISLDKESGRFVSQKDTTLVTGRVVIAMGKSKQVEGLKLHFKGKAKAVWSEVHGKHTVTYVGRETFFSEKVLLPSGEHSYPFCLSLPPDLPTSCLEVHGAIKYTIEAVVERSWKTDFNTKRKLHVIAPLDLSTSPDFMMPGRYSNEKRFCCLWCRSGPLTLVLSLPARGVVIGKDFAVTVEADNASNVDVLELVAKVKKYTTFWASSPWAKCRLLKKTICAFSFGAVSARGTASKTASLPPLTEPAVNVDRCQVLDIDYYLEVTARISGCHGNLRVKKQIKFGAQAPDRADYQYANAGFVPDFDDFRSPPPPYTPQMPMPFEGATPPYTPQMPLPFEGATPPFPIQMPQPLGPATEASAPPLEPKQPLEG